MGEESHLDELVKSRWCILSLCCVRRIEADSSADSAMNISISQLLCRGDRTEILFSRMLK